MPLFGVLSDRLRSLFGGDVADWPAYRESEEITDMPAAAYDGHQLGDDTRGDYRGRHRGEQ